MDGWRRCDIYLPQPFFVCGFIVSGWWFGGTFDSFFLLSSLTPSRTPSTRSPAGRRDEANSPVCTSRSPVFLTENTLHIINVHRSLPPFRVFLYNANALLCFENPCKSGFFFSDLPPPMSPDTGAFVFREHSRGLAFVLDGGVGGGNGRSTAAVVLQPIF